VQIAFQVFSAGHHKKDDYACVPGTMPGYIHYHDSDYIYALNPVAAKYGGGTEIWRLKVPGMPRIHFYPRHPKPPQEGPVKGGKLIITHEGNTRIVECAIPWSEIPELKAKRDAYLPEIESGFINEQAAAKKRWKCALWFTRCSRRRNGSPWRASARSGCAAIPPAG
jgi:hypothetical protein